MPFVFPILINEDFSEAYMQIPILMLGSVFNILVSFIGSIYVAKKLTKEIKYSYKFINDKIHRTLCSIYINIICIFNNVYIKIYRC